MLKRAETTRFEGLAVRVLLNPGASKAIKGESLKAEKEAYNAKGCDGTQVQPRLWTIILDHIAHADKQQRPKGKGAGKKCGAADTHVAVPALPLAALALAAPPGPAPPAAASPGGAPPGAASKPKAGKGGKAAKSGGRGKKV